MRSIGVVVTIPEPWGTQLQGYREAIGDDMATLIPPHITLVPPVDIAAASVAEVEQHLATVAGATAPFRVHLRGTGTFRPVSPVVFVSVASGISACERLSERMRQGPLGIDLAFPYHPHVTVAHNLPDDALDRAFRELAGFECEFAVDRFDLFVHDHEGDGWSLSQTYSLG